jgi:lysophospholipase L1-like esterase
MDSVNLTIDKSSMIGRQLVIAALGTSLTKRGAWLEALPSALEPLLGRPVRTLNFGAVGANSRWGLAHADEVACARPDLVIVEFAINDAAIHRGVSLADSAANLTAIVERFRNAATTRLYLMAMNPATGIRGVLRPRLATYYDLHARLAASLRTGFIDNRPAWAALSAAKLARALPDGLHPTDEAAVAITLANVVRELARDLTESAGSVCGD